MGNNLGISCAARLRKLLAQPSWFLKGDSNFLGSSSSLLIFEKSSVVSYAKKGKQASHTSREAFTLQGLKKLWLPFGKQSNAPFLFLACKLLKSSIKVRVVSVPMLVSFKRYKKRMRAYKRKEKKTSREACAA